MVSSLVSWKNDLDLFTLLNSAINSLINRIDQTFNSNGDQESNLGTFTRRRVRRTDGTPVSGVGVSVFNQSAQMVYSTVTNEEGIYEVKALPPGRYTYRLSHSSFAELSFEVQFILPEQPDIV